MLEYAVLSKLSEAEERTRTMSELAEFVSASLSRLSHVVTRHERRGWVRRSTCPASLRVTLAMLTDEGAEVVEAAPHYVRVVRSSVIEVLEADQSPHLTTVSGRLLDILSQRLG